MLRSISLITLVLLAAGTLSVLAAPPNDRKVVASYYVWYGNPDVSGKWIHWNEGGHDPDKLLPNRKADIGAVRHPVSLYDSSDPVTARQHLQAARQAGIDGLVTSWWGQNDFSDRAFRVVLKEAEKSPVKVAIYYERIPNDGNDPNAAEKTVSDFEYILANYAKSPGYFRYGNKPLVLIYSRALGQLSFEKWAEVVRQVRAKGAMCLLADSENPRWLQIFDGLHNYNPLTAVAAEEDMEANYGSLVKACRSAGKVSVATVIPGYDDSNIGRKGPIVLDRENGELYRRLWRAAVKSKPDMVLITSFNEWHEGSEIETSQEFGNLYMDLTGIYAGFFRKADADGIITAPGIRITAAGQSMVSCVSTGRGCLEIRNLDGKPASVTISGASAKAVVFELGRDSRHLRSIPVVRDASGNIRLKLASASEYELWDISKFLNYTASLLDGEVKKAAGITGVVRTPKQIHKAYAQLAKNSKQVAVRMLLADASTAILRLSSEITGQYPCTDPCSYNVFNGFPFTLKVTLKNNGKATVWNPNVSLMIPEDWEIQPKNTELADKLAPGKAVSTAFTVTPTLRTDMDTPIPAIAWITYEADGTTIKTQNNCLLYSLSPVEFDAVFANAGADSAEMKVIMRSNFPGMKMSGTRAAVQIPRGWKADGEGVGPNPKIDLEFEKTLDILGTGTASFILHRPADDKPGEKTVRVRGYIGKGIWGKRLSYEGSVDLRARNLSAGLSLVDVEDGATEVVTIDGQECRKIIRANPKYGVFAYFNIDDRFVTGGDTWVTVEYYDESQGRFLLQYDSSDKSLKGLDAAYKATDSVAFTGSKSWNSKSFRIPDLAAAGRQNGKADFRIFVEGEGILAVRRVIVSKFPPR